MSTSIDSKGQLETRINTYCGVLVDLITNFKSINSLLDSVQNYDGIDITTGAMIIKNKIKKITEKMDSITSEMKLYINSIISVDVADMDKGSLTKNPNLYGTGGGNNYYSNSSGNNNSANNGSTANSNGVSTVSNVSDKAPVSSTNNSSSNSSTSNSSSNSSTSNSSSNSSTSNSSSNSSDDIDVVISDDINIDQIDEEISDNDNIILDEDFYEDSDNLNSDNLGFDSNVSFDDINGFSPTKNKNAALKIAGILAGTAGIAGAAYMGKKAIDKNRENNEFDNYEEDDLEI